MGNSTQFALVPSLRLRPTTDFSPFLFLQMLVLQMLVHHFSNTSTQRQGFSQPILDNSCRDLVPLPKNMPASFLSVMRLKPMSSIFDSEVFNAYFDQPQVFDASQFLTRDTLFYY